jgi:hypothetical protein
MQDEIARLVLAYAGEEQSVIPLTPEEEADLAESDIWSSVAKSPRASSTSDSARSASSSGVSGMTDCSSPA